MARADDGLGPRLDRRRFLGLSLAAVAAACSGANERSATTTGPATSTTRPRRPPPLPGPVFTLGVASGDPRPDRVVLWTRLAPDPLAGGGMPGTEVEVAWEVARDGRFRDVVQQGVVTALPDLAHSLHVDVAGLEPDRAYHYRFHVGDETSPAGVTRTLPPAHASPGRLRLAVATCQGREWGRYAAYRHLVEQGRDDLLVFLGDYIYEYAPGTVAPTGTGREHTGGVATTLADYRDRYAQYKTDPDLQAVHAALPWYAIWDDHEVEDNYEADVSHAGTPPAEFARRRAAAYRAWYEHLPVRIAPPAGSDVRIYRAFDWGDLARVALADVRQYGDPPPCRDTSTFDAGPDCPERAAPGGTFLGGAQEAWLDRTLRASPARWNLLAQGVLLAGLDAAPDPAAPERTYYLDSWDGHPAARTRLLDLLGSVRDPVVLTGDYHAAFVADVKTDPWDPASPVVATEFVTPAISSVPFPSGHASRNPHIRYADPTNGYLRCTLTRDAVTAEFFLVDDVWDAASSVRAAAAFTRVPGDPAAQPV